MTRRPKYQSPQEPDGALEELLAKAGNDLRHVIHGLMECRELDRDRELARLDEQAKHLIRDLETLNRERLIAELQCFRDLLDLHRRLPER